MYAYICIHIYIYIYINERKNGCLDGEVNLLSINLSQNNQRKRPQRTSSHLPGREWRGCAAGAQAEGGRMALHLWTCGLPPDSERVYPGGFLRRLTLRGGKTQKGSKTRVRATLKRTGGVCQNRLLTPATSVSHVLGTWAIRTHS